jgi:sortase A
VENAAWAGRTVDERVTLITCWPPVGNSHRLILVAFPFESTPTPTP